MKQNQGTKTRDQKKLLRKNNEYGNEKKLKQKKTQKLFNSQYKDGILNWQLACHLFREKYASRLEHIGRSATPHGQIQLITYCKV